MYLWLNICWIFGLDTARSAAFKGDGVLGGMVNRYAGITTAGIGKIFNYAVNMNAYFFCFQNENGLKNFF